jgi:hypothetical protein
VYDCITQEMRAATLVVDACSAPGMQGPARGKALDGFVKSTPGFPHASVIAVDVPSGMNSDSGVSEGRDCSSRCLRHVHGAEGVSRAAANCDRKGKPHHRQDGSPEALMDAVTLMRRNRRLQGGPATPCARHEQGRLRPRARGRRCCRKDRRCGNGGACCSSCRRWVDDVASSASKYSAPELMTEACRIHGSAGALTHRKAGRCHRTWPGNRGMGEAARGRSGRSLQAARWFWMQTR